MKIQPFLHEIWTHIYIVTIGNDQILIPQIALSIESPLYLQLDIL